MKSNFLSILYFTMVLAFCGNGLATSIGEIGRNTDIVTTVEGDSNYLYDPATNQQAGINNAFELRTGGKAVAKSGTDPLFIVIAGQSNAESSTGAYPPVFATTGEFPLTYFEKWNPSGSSTPYKEDFDDIRWGIEAQVFKTLREGYPDAPIYIARYAVGGTPISQWVPGQIRYINLVANVQAFQTTYPSAGSPDVFVWCQGESDYNSTTYSTSLDLLFDGLKSDLSAPDLVFIQNGIGYFQVDGVPAPVNAEKIKWTAEGKNRFYFDTYDCEYRVDETVHYNLNGILRMSERFANIISDVYSRTSVEHMSADTFTAAKGYVAELSVGKLNVNSLSDSQRYSGINAYYGSIVDNIENLKRNGEVVNFASFPSNWGYAGELATNDYPRHIYATGDHTWTSTNIVSGDSLYRDFDAGLTDYTVSMWIRAQFDSVPAYSYPLATGYFDSVGGDSWEYFQLWKSTTNSVDTRTRMFGTGYSANYVRLNDTNQWHHYVYQRDGTNYATYVDGEFQNLTSNTSPNNGYLVFGSPFGYNSNGQSFDIDDVYFSTNILTEAEIQTLYNFGLESSLWD